MTDDDENYADHTCDDDDDEDEDREDDVHEE